MLLKDADELKKSMERMLCTGKEPDKERYTCDVVCCVIDEAPSVDAEPVRHGRWVENGYACGEIEWKCTACGNTEWRVSSCRLKWCPFCGAKMDGGDDGETD